MIEKLFQKLFTRVAFLFLVTAIFASSSNVWGQCVNVTYNKNIFKTVTGKYKEKLTQKFEIFLQKKCSENISEVYEMLTSSFRQLNKKEDYISNMEEYYSGKNKFVSFNPTEVTEFSSSEDKVISFWFIEGCITEVIGGKKRSKKTILEAVLEGEEIFFTADITTRPNPLGNTQKCESQ